MDKHKYKVGDKVVYINWNAGAGEYQVARLTVHNSSKSGDVIEYDLEETSFVYNEDELYTPKEAIEFITNYINKTED